MTIRFISCILLTPEPLSLFTFSQRLHVPLLPHSWENSFDLMYLKHLSIDDKMLTQQEKHEKSTADFLLLLRLRCDSLPDDVSSALEGEYMYLSALRPYRRHEALQIMRLRNVEIKKTSF